MLSCLAASIVTMGPRFSFAVSSSSGGIFPGRVATLLILLPFARRALPRNNRGARSAVVREQTGYRAVRILGCRAHLIIVKIHARDLHSVFADIKDVSRGPLLSLSLHLSHVDVCVTALDDRRTYGRYERQQGEEV